MDDGDTEFATAPAESLVRTQPLLATVLTHGILGCGVLGYVIASGGGDDLHLFRAGTRGARQLLLVLDPLTIAFLCAFFAGPFISGLRGQLHWDRFIVVGGLSGIFGMFAVSEIQTVSWWLTAEEATFIGGVLDATVGSLLTGIASGVLFSPIGIAGGAVGIVLHDTVFAPPRAGTKHDDDPS